MSSPDLFLEEQFHSVDDGADKNDHEKRNPKDKEANGYVQQHLARTRVRLIEDSACDTDGKTQNPRCPESHHDSTGLELPARRLVALPPLGGLDIRDKCTSKQRHDSYPSRR